MTTPSDLLSRLEVFYDAVPRERAHVEPYGSLVLFVPDGPGFPFYARPALGTTSVRAADIEAVRDRQLKLGLPQAFEWVGETTPALLPAIVAAGLKVLRAPIMVLDPAALSTPPALPDVIVRLLDPESASFAADLAASRAVAAVGFATPGTASGEAGPKERDAAVKPIDPAEAEREAVRVRALKMAHALAESPDLGALASGAYQRVGAVAEVVGVATLPMARRRGLGAAVTAALAQHARGTGADLIFLSAGSEAVARMYTQLGFQRVGTACIAEPA